ncbi:dimethylaniline monooxygenase (N-oxide forming) [Trypanosoma rangeli]|uniref:Dimethylaniline monooxygenase (N-oxide forming) n=1 Tax=Trypanosoma rangeli TaxID=5698 RepID=A0A422NS69_TRYRA|nr:dimethylaniline monooxygenase (N-oxide forming) [Trypanosoma rangeli]RNF08327.1 dimethylaniline monooxygenase (N-oxide forming) [Trypanosoma rangeli]|eukprot:RNF08327.1 dimethylaniline monooxygenase (N-oxide forming) [Trypanosoma rangeli]
MQQQQQLEGLAQCSPATMRQGGAMRDAASAALQRLSCTPSWRGDITKGNRVVSNWIQFRNVACWGRLPGVGHPLRSEGHGMLFTEQPKRTTDSLDEAKTRSMARERRSTGNTADESSSGIFVDNVDAVICVTGYNARYPFFAS